MANKKKNSTYIAVKKAGRNMKWLAQQMGWHVTTLSRKANNPETYQIKERNKIAELLDVEPSEIA